MWIFDGETWTEDDAGKDQRDERPPERDPLPDLQIAEDRHGIAFVGDLTWFDLARAGRPGR